MLLMSTCFCKCIKIRTLAQYFGIVHPSTSHIILYRPIPRSRLMDVSFPGFPMVSILCNYSGYSLVCSDASVSGINKPQRIYQLTAFTVLLQTSDVPEEP